MKIKKNLVFVLTLTGLMQSAFSFAMGPDGRPDGRDDRDGRGDGRCSSSRDGRGGDCDGRSRRDDGRDDRDGAHFGGGGDRIVGVPGSGVPVFTGGVSGGGRTVIVTHHNGSGFRPPVVDVRHDGGVRPWGGSYYPIYPSAPIVPRPGGWGDRPGFDHHHGDGDSWSRPFEYDERCRRHDFDFSRWERRGYRMTTMTCVAVGNDSTGREYPYTDVRDGFRDRISDIQDAALDLCYQYTGYTYRGACRIDRCEPGYEQTHRW